MTPILRLRLELDRTLREREFFTRAVGGRLRGEEYADLLAQYGALLRAVADGAAPAVGLALISDLRALDLPEGARGAAAMDLVLEAARAWGRLLPPALARDIAHAVVGTSWIADALEALPRRFPGANRLLGLLARDAGAGLEGVRRRVSEPELRPRVYAFAELTRGAVLGLATHLDLAWPAPTFVRSGPDPWEDPVTTFDPASMQPARLAGPRTAEVRS